MHTLAQLAAVLTILMGLLNAWRAVEQSIQRDLLVEYGAVLPLGLLIAASAGWAILMLSSGIMALRKPNQMKLLIPLLFLAYTLYSLWLPTETLPSLYGHLFLTIFTAAALWGYAFTNRVNID